VFIRRNINGTYQSTKTITKNLHLPVGFTGATV